MNAPAHIPAEAQTESATSVASPRVRRWARAADYGLEALAIGLMGAAAVALALYAGRRELVGSLAEDYLARRGVEAEVEVIEVDSSGFIGRVRLGSERDPDFTAARVEVALAAPPPPEGAYALRPRAIRVVNPKLKARWTGETLSFGALDPLIEEALSRPPTDETGPLVVIDGGDLRLATPYGPVRLGGSGVVDDSKLVRLDLVSRPARLANRETRARLGAGRLRLRVQDRAVSLSGALGVDSFSNDGARVRDGQVRFEGQAPYPDTKAGRMDGPLRLSLSLAGRGVTAGGLQAGPLDADLGLSGAISGKLSALRYAGAARLDADADALSGEGFSGRGVDVRARLGELVLERAGGGLSGRGSGRVALSGDRIEAGGARLQRASAVLQPQGFAFRTTEAGISGSGPLRVALTAAEAQAGEARVEGLQGTIASSAASVRSGAGGLALSGPARVSARAVRASSGPTSAAGVTLDATTQLGLLAGGRAPVNGTATAQTVRIAGREGGAARDLQAAFEGSAGNGRADLTASARAAVALDPAAARRLAAQVPVVGGEPAYAAAMARALSNATVDASGVRLAAGGGRTEITLTQPVRLASASGARVELAPVGGRRVFGGSGGSFQLSARGGGLPELQASVERYQVTPGGFTADLRTRVALDLAIARGAVLEARGRAVSRGGVFEFRAADCVRVRADAIELGENDLEDLSTRFCPTTEGALVRASGGGYRVQGRFDDTSVNVPFLETRVTGAQGAVDARGDAGGLTAVAARIGAAEAADTAAVRRYHPVALSGVAALAGGDWTADLQLAERVGGAALGAVRVSHDQASATGGAAISAPALTFAPDGLQPHDLTPLGAGVISQVQGTVGFEGRIDWNPAGGASSGRVTTEGLNFDSPAGRVVGLKQGLTLSSLTPLIAPPGQVLTAERVEAIVPMEQVQVRFGLAPEAVQVEAANFTLAGGQVTVEPLAIPLTENAVITGAVQLDEVDIGRLIEASAFADKVRLQAVVDGRVPFQTGPEGLRFRAGSLRSTRPGRLSIDRDVLSGVQASGGPTPAPPSEPSAPGVPADFAEAPPGPAPVNAFQDFAYQALENLAYDDLEVEVESRPEGRLGLIFKVRGRHDPPRAEQARIGLLDLLRGRAFEKRIPLPKGTPVNLTLDTSLNFDELMATYMELNRRSGGRSEPVQRP